MIATSLGYSHGENGSKTKFFFEKKFEQRGLQNTAKWRIFFYKKLRHFSFLVHDQTCNWLPLLKACEKYNGLPFKFAINREHHWRTSLKLLFVIRLLWFCRRASSFVKGLLLFGIFFGWRKTVKLCNSRIT